MDILEPPQNFGGRLEFVEYIPVQRPLIWQNRRYEIEHAFWEKHGGQG